MFLLLFVNSPSGGWAAHLPAVAKTDFLREIQMILLADAIYCDSSVVGLPQPVMSYTPWAGADDNFDDGAKDGW